jgi:predicted enzyme related to lactoylglutathione lyase
MDAEAAGRRAEAAGAASVGASTYAATGRVVSIVDPQGAALSLLEPR